MGSLQPFESLVSDLDQEEKNSLLEKLKSQAVLSVEPLVSAKSVEPAMQKPEVMYQKMPLLLRIWYWLCSFFTGKNPVDMYLNSLIAVEGRLINAQNPGVFDYEENTLKDAFYREIKNLKEAGRFFYTMLDSSVNGSKGAFYGYLGSIKMPDVHSVFAESSDPVKLSSEHPEMSDAKLRASAIENIEAALSSISEEKRGLMYEDARTLFLMKTISSFLYDRLIVSFASNHESGLYTCPAFVVRSQLMELGNVLFSLKEVPSIDVLSAIFVFCMAEYGENSGFDQDKEMQKFLQRAEKAITVIRNFNKNIPLIKIIRCINRDFTWKPKEISGGEDWFSIYKNYWLDAASKNYFRWIQERRNAELVSSLSEYFEGAMLQPVDNTWSNENENGIPVDNVLCLSFLLTFHKIIFMKDINVIIRPILVDGEFKKKDNQGEFMESYNIMIKLDDSIGDFTKALAASGEYGKVWAHIADDIQSISVRRRKTQSLLDDLNKKSIKIVDDAKRALISMGHIIDGIVMLSNDSRYDTLVNFTKLAGKGSVFTEGLVKAVQNIKKAVNIIEDINDASKPEMP